MITDATVYSLAIFIFIVGYLTIMFEFPLKVNKTASALLMGVLMWTFLFLVPSRELGRDIASLGEHLGNISQIIFFLLGAMAIVELIDSHKGFQIITDWIQVHSKRKMLWMIGLLAFFLSSILDNLTTTIVMVSLLRKLITDRQERMVMSSMVVIAANAGGAWTPIGDVTTTMLWINGNITSVNVIKSLFLPSFCSFAIALAMLTLSMKGTLVSVKTRESRIKEPGARLVFVAGVCALILVPLFKAWTGLPPYMGILMGLGALWLLTDVLHGHAETRKHLKVPHVFTKIDISGVLFFLGILLCISALETLGILQQIAQFLNKTLGEISLIATMIGLISAVIDNVPLVAAGMGMYDFPVDSFFWLLLAYCAGTGGSILIIGSAAGVALMGMEKIDFLWYLRKISWIALISYLSGIGIYVLQRALTGV